MSKSFLTDAEIKSLQSSGLDRKTPFGIGGVRFTQLSIARHFGGISYNGAEYTYFPDTDELWRNDVLKQIKRAHAPARRARAAAPIQGRLPSLTSDEASNTTTVSIPNPNFVEE